ncbi:MAG: hypothetical protein ICV69_10080 [Thermoleophilaceae bacterium]|nr:hypothetical protein [Thermoleophilaceae bacterium]
MSGPRTRQELNEILLFNSAFFVTLAWFGSAAVVADEDGWWYELGQFALTLVGVVLVWLAWWHDSHGRSRVALQVGGGAVAILSLWVTSVHSVLF